MGKLKKTIVLMISFLILVGCESNKIDKQDTLKSDIEGKNETLIQAEEQDETTNQTNTDLFEGLDIEKYDYPNEFEVDNNLAMLLENMAVNYKHYSSENALDVDTESSFIRNFCQNSWFCFDYIYESLDKSEGIINKQQIEYIQYSLSGNYVEFQSIDDDYEIDVNDCSSGFVYAELASYEVISDEEEIVIEADFNISDNSTEKANVTLVRNEYSCFDGYSVKTFDVFEE